MKSPPIGVPFAKRYVLPAFRSLAKSSAKFALERQRQDEQERLEVTGELHAARSYRPPLQVLVFQISRSTKRFRS